MIFTLWCRFMDAYIEWIGSLFCERTWHWVFLRGVTDTDTISQVHTLPCISVCILPNNRELPRERNAALAYPLQTSILLAAFSPSILLSPSQRSSPSNRPPIRHDPYNTSRPRQLDQFLMPAQQHAHRLSASLPASEIPP